MREKAVMYVKDRNEITIREYRKRLRRYLSTSRSKVKSQPRNI
jgi:hypothetical protein